MDGIALELWNKKLLMGRYKRQLEFKTCLELSRNKGLYFSQTLLNTLFEIGGESLDVLMLHWKETFLGSWQRQKPDFPSPEAEKAVAEVGSILNAEQRQIENELISLGKEQGLEWKADEMREGKAALERKIAIVRASCLAQIADLKGARESDLDLQRVQNQNRRREIWGTRILIGFFVLSSTLIGSWFGASTHAKYSRRDRDYIDAKLREQTERQNQLLNEVNALRKTNRKIAFWTEKTSAQIEQEEQDTRDNLKREIQDIREETTRKIARVESEYARSGRDGGAELESRKQGLAKLQTQMIEAAEERAQKQLNTLEEQKQNLMR